MSENNGSAAAGNPAGGAGEGGNQPWYANLADPDIRGFAELKKWESPEKAIESYRNLEQKLGAPPDRLLKLPEKPDDPAWGEIHKKLGLAAPEKPEDYELPVPEGFNEDYAKAVAAKAKELGIPKHMLKGLGEFNNEYVKRALEADEQAREQRHTTALAELRMEWGGTYEETVALAQRAEELVKREVGLSEESLKAWQDADPKGYYKMLAYQGSRLAEAKKIDGSTAVNSTAAMSPEAARSRLKMLMADKEFFVRWNNGESSAVSEFNALNAIIAKARG